MAKHLDVGEYSITNSEGQVIGWIRLGRDEQVIRLFGEGCRMGILAQVTPERVNVVLDDGAVPFWQKLTVERTRTDEADSFQSLQWLT